jgi:hypothetical protein
VIVLALLLLATAGDPVREALARGDYATALDAAHALPDDGARSAAEALVHHHAGDLRGARALAEEGLARHPEHRQLAHQVAELGAVLRDLPAAERGTEALARALAAEPPAEAERARWSGLLAARRAEVRELAERRGASAAALTRSRVRGGVAGVLALALLAWLARPVAATGRGGR